MKNLFKNIIFFLIYSSLLISNDLQIKSDISLIPVLESGRIKPLESFARNQLILFHGKDYISKRHSHNGEKIEAIDWLINLLMNPNEGLNQNIFFISNWSNSPEVEISLGLDGRDSHRYSFFEVVEGFRENQILLDGLKSKPKSEYTNVEKQIIDLYNKVVLFDQLAHSFKCITPEIEIKNTDIITSLNLKGPTKVSYSFFVNNISLFSPLMAELLEISPENWNDKQKELNKIAMELQTLSQYDYATSLKVVPADSSGVEWLSPWQVMDINSVTLKQARLIFQLEQFINQYIQMEYNDNQISNYYNILKTFDEEINYSNLSREIYNNKINFFSKSLILYILAFIFLGISWMYKKSIFRKISIASILFGFILHVVGIIYRMIIMQRPPVSTLYESIIFVGFVLVLIALIYELVKKDSFGLFVAIVGGAILHFVGLKYAADGDTLGMLVAVLNSNFWLSIHVTTITFGYGVSLVSGLMGHVYLFRAFWFGKKDKQLKSIYDNIYGLTLIALFFTLFGTILGGIWADQSWGRFWGWDPKENGALLIVMWHLLVLHLRITGLAKPLDFAFYASLVNIIVVLAWFGVNLLSVGLHSYGFTDNVALNLFVFIAFELIFCTALYVKVKYFTSK